ncbi:MarR family transcriptional regulator [Rhodovarius sp.]|uniref:MarR family winged helix-turn-helix transcriptional regulator n=1 Tax=Rhodovarius sp. TaxID=2972673 RepID=UPI0033419AE7
MVAANEVSSAVLHDNEVSVTGDFNDSSMLGPYRLDSSTGHLLRRALQRHQALFQESAAATGLTPPQFAALTKLAELRRVTQNRLGRLVAMDPATAQGVMKRLALRGLLRTEKDPMDRRTVVLSITQEGECLVQQARQAGQRANQALMQDLDAGEQAMLLALLRRITD